MAKASQTAAELRKLADALGSIPEPFRGKCEGCGRAYNLRAGRTWK